jgi:hypothetical protein
VSPQTVNSFFSDNMTDKDPSAIPELTMSNYPAWSRKINGYFRRHLLYNLVHEKDPRPVDDTDAQTTWDDKMMKAAGIIEQTLDDTNATHCEGLFGDAVSMWRKLEQVHNAKTPGTRFTSMNTLFNIKKDENEELESLITRTKAAMQRVKNLRPAGSAPTVTVTSATGATTGVVYTLETFDSELIVMTLLRALPESYNHLVSSLYIQSDLDLEMVERAFRAEDNHRKQATSEPASAHRAFVPHHQRTPSAPNQNQPNRWCNHCQRGGHTDATCWIQHPSLRPPRRHQHHHSQPNANAAEAPAQANATTTPNASTSPPPEAHSNLNCDTGATCSMMGDEQSFNTLNPWVREIRLANGRSIYSKGEGDVIFQPWVNGKFSTNPIIFPNVLFAPDLKSNLFSVLSMARKDGYEIRINSKQMEFYREDELKMTARINDNCVAYLNGRVLTSETALASSTLPLNRELWHRRLGHFHHAGIEKIVRDKTVDDLELDSNQPPDPICHPCLAGKQTRAVHTKPMARADEILDRVFMDLHGPIPVESMPDRAKYWFPMVDDMSGYTVIALLRTKDQALQAFRQYKAMVETHTNKKIKSLRDDKGGEFISNEFKQLCAEAGIKREHTNRATPEQNGVVERVNRRISEGATALLNEANLPPSFWGLAVQAYVHVMNRVPSRSRGDKTPYELFWKKKPSVKRLRVFGCAAYVHVQKEQRRALESHTRKCILVGYPIDRPGWTFWDPKTRKIFHSDSATFDEREFPGTSRPKEPQVVLLPNEDESEPAPVPEPINNVPEEDPGPEEPHNEEPEEPAVIVAGRPLMHPNPPANPEVEPEADSEGEQEIGPQLAPNPRLPRLPREVAQLRSHFSNPPSNLPSRRTTRGRQQGAMTEPDTDEDEEEEVELAEALMSDVLEEKEIRQRSPAPTEYVYIPLVDAVEYALSTDITIEPRTLAEALTRPDADKYVESAIEEVKAHLDNGTWTVVRLPKGKRAIGSRWVFKIKRNADGSVDRYKGRIVAKGYSQREGVDYTETFAPTARFGALRAVIALAALEDMELESIDIATAFLNGVIDAEVYMQKPEGVEIPGHEGPEWVLKLLKALYGIKQGPRCWSKRLHTVMTDIGFRRLECDHSVFVYERDGVKVIVPVHVDDLVLASKSKEGIAKVKSELMERFKLRDQGPTSFILGVRLERDREQRTIALSQPAYIDSILRAYGMQDCNPANVPMDPKMRLSSKMSPTTEAEKAKMKTVPYREAVGKLLYLSIATRPDIAYAVSVLCRFTDNPGREHWGAVKRILRYLKKTRNYKLIYAPNTSNELFTTHSDADLGGNPDNSRSTAGFVISIGGGAVLWSSRLQRQVAMSSTEAEYTTAAATGTEIIWMREFFEEIGYDISTPSTLFIDNASAIQVAKNPEHQSTMKHVHRSYHWLRERVNEGDIRVRHVPGSENVADIFTKPLGPTKFKQCCTLLGLRE